MIHKRRTSLERLVKTFYFISNHILEIRKYTNQGFVRELVSILSETSPALFVYLF